MKKQVFCAAGSSNFFAICCFDFMHELPTSAVPLRSSLPAKCKQEVIKIKTVNKLFHVSIKDPNLRYFAVIFVTNFIHAIVRDVFVYRLNLLRANHTGIFRQIFNKIFDQNSISLSVPVKLQGRRREHAQSVPDDKKKWRPILTAMKITPIFPARMNVDFSKWQSLMKVLSYPDSSCS